MHAMRKACHAGDGRIWLEMTGGYQRSLLPMRDVDDE
jgi:hypothetical protein